VRTTEKYEFININAFQVIFQKLKASHIKKKCWEMALKKAQR